MQFLKKKKKIIVQYLKFNIAKRHHDHLKHDIYNNINFLTLFLELKALKCFL